MWDYLKELDMSEAVPEKLKKRLRILKARRGTTYVASGCQR